MNNWKEGLERSVLLFVNQKQESHYKVDALAIQDFRMAEGKGFQNSLENRFVDAGYVWSDYVSFNDLIDLQPLRKVLLELGCVVYWDSRKANGPNSRSGNFKADQSHANGLLELFSKRFVENQEFQKWKWVEKIDLGIENRVVYVLNYLESQGNSVMPRQGGSHGSSNFCQQRPGLISIQAKLLWNLLNQISGFFHIQIHLLEILKEAG